MSYFPTVDENETNEQATAENITAIPTEDSKPAEKPKRRPFAIWSVGGTDYKLRLSTEAIAELEGRYKTNLLNLMATEGEALPAMSIMLDVAFAAIKKYNHGISRKDMFSLFDRYVDEGGSQLRFYTDVFTDIFAVSGFFTTEAAEALRTEMQDIRDRM